MGDAKRVPYWGPANIRRFVSRFSRLGDLALAICAPVVWLVNRLSYPGFWLYKTCWHIFCLNCTLPSPVLESLYELWGPSLCRFLLAPVAGMVCSLAVLVALPRTVLIARCCHVNACSTSVSPRAYPRPFLCQWRFVPRSQFAALCSDDRWQIHWTGCDVELPCLRRVDERFWFICETGKCRTVRVLKFWQEDERTDRTSV